MTHEQSQEKGPQDPGWAGNFTFDHWMFVRDGRWHIHDAESGAILGIMPLFDPEVANGW